jgi:hypothetical protein
MDACQKLMRSFFVQGYKVTATFTMVAGEPISTVFDWEPIPKRIGHRFVVEYRKKRDAVIKSVADELNGSVVVIDQLDRRPLITAIQPGDAETIREYA